MMLWSFFGALYFESAGPLAAELRSELGTSLPTTATASASVPLRGPPSFGILGSVMLIICTYIYICTDVYIYIHMYAKHIYIYMCHIYIYICRCMSM